MDTSKTYIQMAKMAEVIQGTKKMKFGDFIFNGTEVEILEKSHEVFYKRSPEYLKTDIWLPRQDQLQEIYLNSSKTNYAKASDPDSIFQMAVDFYKYLKVNKDIRPFTMEQAWLMFIMDMFYNRKWVPITEYWTIIS